MDEIFTQACRKRPIIILRTRGMDGFNMKIVGSLFIDFIIQLLLNSSKFAFMDTIKI